MRGLSARQSQAMGFDGLNGYGVHLVLAAEAATALFALMGAIIDKDPSADKETVGEREPVTNG